MHLIFNIEENDNSEIIMMRVVHLLQGQETVVAGESGREKGLRPRQGRGPGTRARD